VIGIVVFILNFLFHGLSCYGSTTTRNTPLERS
jgi:hypothetical protein